MEYDKLSEELQLKLEKASSRLTEEQKELIHYNNVMEECVKYLVDGGKDGFQG